MIAIEVLSWTTYVTCGLLLLILAGVCFIAWTGTRYKVIVWQIILLFVANVCYFPRQVYTEKAVICVSEIDKCSLNQLFYWQTIGIVF